LTSSAVHGSFRKCFQASHVGKFVHDQGRFGDPIGMDFQGIYVAEVCASPCTLDLSLRSRRLTYMLAPLCSKRHIKCTNSLRQPLHPSSPQGLNTPKLVAMIMKPPENRSTLQGGSARWHTIHGHKLISIWRPFKNTAVVTASAGCCGMKVELAGQVPTW
jgi:hypothetical protein